MLRTNRFSRGQTHARAHGRAHSPSRVARHARGARRDPGPFHAEPLESRTLLFAGAAADYVILISVDGLRPDVMDDLGEAPKTQQDPLSASNFYRFINSGAYTQQARTDDDVRVTLPNHTSQLTSRRVTQSQGGHGWLDNDPPFSTTIHGNNPPYVDSIFNVVKAAGLSTAMYATKDKFEIYNLSYNGHALYPQYPDVLDTFYNAGTSTTTMMNQLLPALDNPKNLTFVHFYDPDAAGHANPSGGWMSPLYLSEVSDVNDRLGQIFAKIDNVNSPLHGRTTVILTADHGGFGYDHSDDIQENYTIPFYVWGAGVKPGELYTLSDHTRNLPAVNDNPAHHASPYTALTQPIRNGDAGNLAADLLGLGSVPNSQINLYQNLNVGTLDIDGTSGPDTISVTLNGANFDVIRNAESWSVPAGQYAQILVRGGDGIDNIDIGDTVTLPTTLSGGAGADVLNGGGGNDTLLGGADGDTYVFAGAIHQGSDVVDDSGASGTDALRFWGLNTAITIDLENANSQTVSSLLNLRLANAGNVENVATSTTYVAGGDDVRGNAAANRIETFGGDDRLEGRGGNDTLLGGNGGDAYVFAGSADLGSDELSEAGANSGNPDLLDFEGLAGPITLNLNLTTAQVVSAGLLTLRLTSPWNVENVSTSTAAGNTHADNVQGNSLGNKIWTWGGNDTVYGGWGNDTLFGGNHDDRIVGDNEMGSLATRGGNDVIWGEDGADQLFGDARLNGYSAGFDYGYGNGDDEIHGGAGNDTVQGDAWIVHVMRDGDDLLFGDDGADVLWGDDGPGYDFNNMSYAGYGGDDVLEGGKDGDDLRAQNGNDTYRWRSSDWGATKQFDSVTEYYYGGYGDTLDFGNVAEDVVVNLSTDAAASAADVVLNKLRFAFPHVAATPQHLEHVNGGTGDDVLTGNSSGNTLRGNGGDDDLFGYFGNDRLEGGSGVDGLHGDSGNDTMVGGAGSDLFSDNTGTDRFEAADSETDIISGSAGGDTLLKDDQDILQ